MAISDVIEFKGSPEDLVWKYSGEEFNATSQLIVEDTHQAILVVNGQTADLFGAGRHTLSVPNIPLLKKIVSIPTGGVSPFRCKVFYISRVHQMDMLWGTNGAITLNDPEYEIFLHIMLRGSMTFSIIDSRKFLIKLAGFNRMTRTELIDSFRGIISANVKDCISKIMINGKYSYFNINASLFEISAFVQKRLAAIFSEYGVGVEIFNIESIDVPKEDYDSITKAKERRAGRIIEGYTWQEERRMDIAEAFAGNEGTMGDVGGAVGGFMMGGAFGGQIRDIAREAMDPRNDPTDIPPGSVSQASGGPKSPEEGFDVGGFLGGDPTQEPAEDAAPVPAKPGFCSGCGAKLVEGAVFCHRCGKKQAADLFCSNCGRQLKPDQIYCPHCGTKV